MMSRSLILTEHNRRPELKTDKRTGRFFAFFRRLLQRLSEKDQVLVLSLVVGIFCGLASVLLKLAIEWIHHAAVSFPGTGSGYNVMYLVFPGLGMLLSMLFVRHVIS